jgi:geranylgeranyl pyrophosphate synthase
MSAAPLASYLAGLRTEVEAALHRVLDRLAPPRVIAAPLAYALIAPGKRLRPCLTLAAAETIGESRGLPASTAQALALPAACAVEMIHTYSLVHDDLPAMDNDDMRRGRPTTHVVHGDGLATLAGDGLLTDAFAVLASDPSPASVPDAPSAPASARLHALRVLAEAAGSRGMVGGQAIDLASVGRVSATGVVSLDADSLRDMHARKTGALIRAASTMGAILAGATASQVDAIDRYAAELGLAFQIVDDVLDVEGSAEALGKTAGKDAAAGKPTFPALYGLDRSRQLARECIDRAAAALDDAGLEGRLRDIATWSLQRRS